jgi:hypothetical protein
MGKLKALISFFYNHNEQTMNLRALGLLIREMNKITLCSLTEGLEVNKGWFDKAIECDYS